MNIFTSTNEMDIELLRSYCLKLHGSEESTPFGPDVLVYKVGGKIFCLFNLEEFRGINVKCEAELAIELRERFAGIEPGYHMNKNHWNTLRTDMGLEPDFILEQIRNSYGLVVKSLPKKTQRELISK
jgi:predicted DNA-binding protein (MmcQ/YjbR family)